MQMGDGAEANKEFMEQLRLQELYGQTNEEGSNPFTYTDPEDGTVYDWDHEKKAWFPKVGQSLPALHKIINSSLYYLNFYWRCHVE